MPEHLLKHDLVQSAVAEVDPSQLWDCHVHVAGVGDGNTGIWITPQMRSLWHPWQRLQHRFFLNASCTKREGSVDEDFVRHLLHCLDAFPRQAKAMLLAFDFFHDEHGAPQEDLSSFFIPNRYVAGLSQRFSDRFEGICSIHPYRDDAIDEIDWSARHHARAVKWCPLLWIWTRLHRNAIAFTRPLSA